MHIIKATKVKSKARICLAGPAGSGKTYSALAMAGVFGKRIIVIDSENSSSAEYADEFPWSFDILPLEDSFSPSTYVDAIHMCESRGYDVIICDSLSHAWFGPEGELELVDRAAKKYSGNSFYAWKDVTPERNKFIHSIVHCQAHFIGTMRSKVESVMDTDESTGKKKVTKLGMKPIQKEGMDYEFNVYGDIDLQHNWAITKTRCTTIDQRIFHKPGQDVAEIILSWLNKGEDPLVQRERIFLMDHGFSNWSDVQKKINMDIPKPSSIEEWNNIDILIGGLK